MGKSQNSANSSKSGLVAEVADRLRDTILALPDGEQIGSLTEVAGELGVGIVTVQQAARILEHEGLLAVKRGPGGGYYGTRPDNAAIERAFATYMRVRHVGYREAFELTVLLDCDIIRATAKSLVESQSAAIERLLARLQSSTTESDCIEFEIDFRETLLEIVERPLLELLSRVAMQLYSSQPGVPSFANAINLEDWRQGRRRILQAILQRDEELANFEAHRYRRMVLDWTFQVTDGAAR